MQNFSQCLHLVDGRFSQLHTLIVDLAKIPNLKCFFLSSAWKMSPYDELILPLIYQMFNLEKLDLYLAIYVRHTFINENDLKKNILKHMPQLNVFEFHIRSLMSINNQMNLSLKEEM
ncbi:unnamed protein product [Adineta steineri]|uniref:Uncharacterized protein n=1 Tax=Adineta steineri TaxID=433720 RepID=A0A820FNT4_9BILA|nr:unnamed protein product [Adineta steineri]CAF4264654.1 unnamed protein product [Adineta steineri]